MQIKTSNSKYGLIRRINHWLVAVLFVNILAVGFYMEGLAPTPEKWDLYGMHKSFGLIIIVLISIRFLWLAIDNKIDNSGLTKAERVASASVHGSLYLLMIIMPLSGLLMSMFGGYSVKFFNLFTLPNFVEKNTELSTIMSNTHHYIGFILAGLIIIHILASLFHHFIKKDGILKRMM